MVRYALLIEYNYCTGCQACVTACSQELNLPAEKVGIHLVEVGPEVLGPPKMYFFPFPTDECTLCAHRTIKGLKPACASVCPAGAIKGGSVEELAEYMKKNPKTIIWAPL